MLRSNINLYSVTYHNIKTPKRLDRFMNAVFAVREDAAILGDELDNPSFRLADKWVS